MNLKDRLAQRRSERREEPQYPPEQAPQGYLDERMMEPEPEYSPIPEEEAVEPYTKPDETDTQTLDDISKDRTPKGLVTETIQGVPVDLHSLEGYILKISPRAIKNIMDSDATRIYQEAMNMRSTQGKKLSSKTWILILLCVGMAFLGIFLLMFLPDIIAMFSGGVAP